MERLYNLVSDFSVDEFSLLIESLLTEYISLFLICIVLYFLFRLLFEVAVVLINRKKKYKFHIDIYRIFAFRYVSRLRKQVLSTPFYYDYYNRLVGVVGFLLYMGYINNDYAAKILDVPMNFNGD